MHLFILIQIIKHVIPFIIRALPRKASAYARRQNGIIEYVGYYTQISSLID